MGANQFTSSALQGKSELVLNWRSLQSSKWLVRGWPALQTIGSGKSNIIAGTEAHTFCLFYILYRITRWGEGKSTSIMQSPAAYTLPVKLLTSTNDFLMIGPSIPQSCLLTNTHARTHTYRTRALPHTSIMSFIKGSTCGLMDHCKCHSHSHYCIRVPTRCFFSPPCHLFFGDTTCGA